MNVTLTNIFYCTASKITLLQLCMTSADPPSIMFVEFCHEKIHNGNTRPPALCAGETHDERLKINKLGPYAKSKHKQCKYAITCSMFQLTQSRACTSRY